MRFIFICAAVLFSNFPLRAEPDSTSAEAPADFKPQIIHSEAVIYPRKMLAKGIEGVVITRFIVNTEGNVVDATIVSSPHEALSEAALEAVRKYKFSPGIRDGKPVDVRIKMPLTFKIVPKNKTSGENAPPPGSVTPVVTYMPPLEYPEGMGLIGVKADVLVGLIVSTDGTVLTAEIVNSNNPAFNDAAIKTALKMRFTTALKDGKPVNFRATQPFTFRIEDMRNDGNSSYGITPIKDPLTGNTAPPRISQIKNVELAVFPHALLGQMKTGKAQILILVNEKGNTAGIKIIEASAPEFGFAAAAAAETFVFDPAPAERPHEVRSIVYDLDFTDRKDNGKNLLPNLALLKRESKKPASIAKGSDLDLPLQLRSRKAPAFPQNLDLKQSTGESVIEFLVDEKGNVALPRIVSATSPEFGYAGIQAVSTWRFDPPTVGGKKATVRVQQPFTFKQTDAAQSPAPAK